MGSDKRGHKKRKRRSSDSSTEEDDAGLSNWKLGMVVAVVVICFAMLYPTVFHPLLMSFFGGRQEQPKPTQQRPPMHHGMGSRPGPRSDVHPAMRMAQSQAETTQAQGGGRGGMSTWMLPVYTVGVVVFLLYTLFKSKNKKKKRSRYDIESSEEEEELMGGYKRGRHSGSGDKKKKMHGLQERLRQTEEAMARILEQLEKVQAEGLSLADSADNQQEQEAGKVEEVHDDDEIQNADVDAEEEQQPSTSKPANPEIEDVDPLKTKQGERYLSDLEQALADFKVLSDEYDAVKHGKKGRRSHSSSSESASETSDSEKMSSPDSEDSKSEEEEKISERRPKKKHVKEYVDNIVKESVIPKKKEAEAKTRRRIRRE